MTLQLSCEQAPIRIDDLLQENAEYLAAQKGKGELLAFHTNEGHDVYNITAPFKYEGQELIAGRTEARDDEIRSETRFFRHDLLRDIWIHDQSLPTLALQDPFVKKIHQQWVVGGVKVYPRIDSPTEVEGWETHIYCGHDLRNLQLLAIGPYRMKDIRLVELPDREVGIFTRPQGEKGGLGKVGFTTVRSLEDINARVLQEAPIIPELFSSEHKEWGGVNEAHVLEDGRIGAVGHIARLVAAGESERPTREYLPITFIFDSMTRVVSHQRIFGRRDCFPKTEAKKYDTEHVLFSGGIRVLGEQAVWWGGVTDSRAGRITGPNPYGMSLRPAVA